MAVMRVALTVNQIVSLLPVPLVPNPVLKPVVAMVTIVINQQRGVPSVNPKCVLPIKLPVSVAISNNVTQWVLV
jgi:hypothetical protein